MSTFLIIFLAIVTIAITMFAVYMGERNDGEDAGDGEVIAGADTNTCMSEEEKEKHERLEKVLTFARERVEVRNDDVEELLGVSNTTAQRYLNDLETEGKLKQIGTEGRGVYYVLVDSL